MEIEHLGDSDFEGVILDSETTTVKLTKLKFHTEERIRGQML